MWNPDCHASPESFNARRYIDKGAFTASSKEHNVFGMGRHMCPGRFFADTELKLCLAHMLLEYDFRLQAGYVSQSGYYGTFPMVDPGAKVEVRRVYR